MEAAHVAQRELEAKQNILWALLEQGTGCLELASSSLQDMVVAQMAALSECSYVSGLPVLMFPGWAWEHLLLLDEMATAFALLQEGQRPKLTTFGVEQGMDLLGRVVAVHQQRNVSAPETSSIRYFSSTLLMLTWLITVMTPPTQNYPKTPLEPIWDSPANLTMQLPLSHAPIPAIMHTL